MVKKENSEGIIQYIENNKSKIDILIKKYLPKKPNKRWAEFVFEKPLYCYNLNIIEKSLTEPLWDFLDRGGKRWRPILFLLILNALGGNIKKLKDFSIIPELIHNGTIIIDDIEDNGKIRRGKPCLHLIYGIDIAVNAANFLYYLPMILLKKNITKIKPTTAKKVYDLYIQELVNLSLGQATDIYWHKNRIENIKKEEYFQMVSYKTGCLSRFSTKLAAILAETSERTVEKLGKIGETIGIAFQIRDDILDIKLAGKERKKFGKSFGNDIKEGKKTLMVIYTLSRANKKDKIRLLKILEMHTDDFKLKKEAIQILTRYKSVEYAHQIAKNIIDNAWKEVNKFLPQSKAKTKLKQFVNYLIDRQN